MKIILLLSRTSYRKNNLNNFSNLLVLNKYMVITFYGPLYFLGLLLKKTKLFKVISIDADPILEKNEGINFWLTGPIHKISKSAQHLKNNFVNMKSVFHNHDRILQIYPIIKKNNISNSKSKIIYLSNCKLRKPEISLPIIKQFKKKFNDNLLEFDNKDFWKLPQLQNYNDDDKYRIYRDLKLNQRVDLIKYIKKNIPDKILVYGNDWAEHFENYNKPITKKSEIKKLYNGNICLDFGSSSGSLTLYPRSIEIIECGGFLLQLKQKDSKLIFDDYENKFTFSTMEELKRKLEYLLGNKNLLNDGLKILKDKFSNSKQLIENQLDKIFNY